MTDRAKYFLEQVSSNEALKTELKNTLESVMKEDYVSNIITFAKQHGYELTKADFVSDSEELSEEELEMISAAGACACVGYGYGEDDGLMCICGFAGSGGVKHMYPDSQGGCVCPGVGAGAIHRH